MMNAATHILTPPKGRLPGIFTYLVVVLWFCGMMYLGTLEVFERRGTFFLSNLQLAIVIPITLFWVLFAWFKPFRAYIYGLDFLFLNSLQCWRVLGGGLLVVWGLGMLPGGFALPMSITDMAVGIGAVYVVYTIARVHPGWQAAALWMNVLGFLDFLFIIALAMFAFVSLPFDPPAPGGIITTVAELPVSMFPSFAIPFFSCVHFAVLVQLRRFRYQAAP